MNKMNNINKIEEMDNISKAHIEELSEKGLELTDMVDMMDFKGTDWKNMDTVKWFQFCKANKAWLDPGISWWELSALHKACEIWKDRPATILETGQCYGTTARYFAIRNIKYGGEFYSIELTLRPKFTEGMKELGLSDSINTIVGHSQKIFWDKPIDILFIDSEHALSDALGEYMKYRLFIAQGSIVGFHDSANCHGVKRTIEIIQEIDDLKLLSETSLVFGAGITMFKVKDMNMAQVRINSKIKDDELKKLLKDREEEKKNE